MPFDPISPVTLGYPRIKKGIYLISGAISPEIMQTEYDEEEMRKKAKEDFVDD